MKRNTNSSLSLTSFSNQQVNTIPTKANMNKVKILKQMIKDLQKKKCEFEKTNRYLKEKTQSVYEENHKLKDAIINRKAYHDQLLLRYSKSINTVEKEFDRNKKMSKIFSSYKRKVKSPQKNDADAVLISEEIKKISKEISDIEKKATDLTSKFSESGKRIYDYTILLSLDSKLTDINKLFTKEANNCISTYKTKPDLFNQLQLSKLQQKVVKGENIKKELLLLKEDEQIAAAKLALNMISDDFDRYLPIYNKILLINQKRLLINEEGFDHTSCEDSSKLCSKLSERNTSDLNSYDPNDILISENLISKVPKNPNMNDEIDELKKIAQTENFRYLKDSSRKENFRQIKYQVSVPEKSIKSDKDEIQRKKEEVLKSNQQSQKTAKAQQTYDNKNEDNKPKTQEQIQSNLLSADISNQKLEKRKKTSKPLKKFTKRTLKAKRSKGVKQNSKTLKTEMATQVSGYTLQSFLSKKCNRTIGNELINEFPPEGAEEESDYEGDYEETIDDIFSAQVEKEKAEAIKMPSHNLPPLLADEASKEKVAEKVRQTEGRAATFLEELEEEQDDLSIKRKNTQKAEEAKKTNKNLPPLFDDEAAKEKVAEKNKQSEKKAATFLEELEEESEDSSDREEIIDDEEVRQSEIDAIFLDESEEEEEAEACELGKKNVFDFSTASYNLEESAYSSMIGIDFSKSQKKDEKEAKDEVVAELLLEGESSDESSYEETIDDIFNECTEQHKTAQVSKENQTKKKISTRLERNDKAKQNKAAFVRQPEGPRQSRDLPEESASSEEEESDSSESEKAVRTEKFFLAPPPELSASLSASTSTKAKQAAKAESPRPSPNSLLVHPQASIPQAAAKFKAKSDLKTEGLLLDMEEELVPAKSPKKSTESHNLELSQKAKQAAKEGAAKASNHSSLPLPVRQPEGRPQAGPRQLRDLSEESASSEEQESEVSESEKAVRTEKFFLAPPPELSASLSASTSTKVEQAAKAELPRPSANSQNQASLPLPVRQPEGRPQAGPRQLRDLSDESASSEEQESEVSESEKAVRTEKFFLAPPPELSTSLSPSTSTKVEQAAKAELPRQSPNSLLVRPQASLPQAPAKSTKLITKGELKTESLLLDMEEDRDAPKVPQASPKPRASEPPAARKDGEQAKPLSSIAKRLLLLRQQRSRPQSEASAQSKLAHEQEPEQEQEKEVASFYVLEEMEFKKDPPKNDANTKKEVRKAKFAVHAPKEKKNPRKSTYDPSVFYTPSNSLLDDCSQKEGKVSITLTLKDIGLEGLDSSTPDKAANIRRNVQQKDDERKVKISTAEKGKEVVCKLNIRAKERQTHSSISDAKTSQRQTNLLDSAQKAHMHQAVKPKTASKNSVKSSQDEMTPRRFCKDITERLPPILDCKHVPSFV